MKMELHAPSTLLYRHEGIRVHEKEEDEYENDTAALDEEEEDFDDDDDVAFECDFIMQYRHMYLDMAAEDATAEENEKDMEDNTDEHAIEYERWPLDQARLRVSWASMLLLRKQERSRNDADASSENVRDTAGNLVVVKKPTRPMATTETSLPFVSRGQRRLETIARRNQAFDWIKRYYFYPIAS
jgi:hypothetical protein